MQGLKFKSGHYHHFHHLKPQFKNSNMSILAQSNMAAAKKLV
jgi:hypothetical protein